MKKFLLSAVVLVSVSAVSFAQHQHTTPATTTTTTTAAPAPANPDGPVMKFEKEVFDFGNIKQGDKVQYEFEFVNTGKEALIITEAHGSCGCTVPEWPKQPLKKGEKGVIKITFDSTGKQGMQDKTVTITSNSTDSPKILHVKGNIEVPAVKPAAPQN